MHTSQNPGADVIMTSPLQYALKEPSESPSNTSQNIYSAQSCLNGSDCQTKPNLKGRVWANVFPMERSPIQTPIRARENTSGSSGGCRFIIGITGLYQCGCTDARQCHKNKAAAVLTLTPRCFLYHDRYVPIISNMFDKRGVPV